MIATLVPARDCAPWIRESLESLVGQSAPPDEILLYDDGSKDGTVEIAESLGIRGLRVLRGETPGGISRALNRMLDETSARYIVRMDADDIAEPDRIARQLDALERRNLAVVGSWARRFGRSDTLHRFAEQDEELKAGLVFASPFCHPSVIVDRDRLRDPSRLRYDSAFDGAEDHDLWIRLRHEGRYGNIPSVLLNWRLHNDNAGSHPEKLARQLEVQGRLRRNLLAEMGVGLTPSQEEAFTLRCASKTLSADLQDSYLEALEAIARGASESLGAPRADLLALLGTHWDLSCHFAVHEQGGIPLRWWRGRRRLGASAPPGTFLKLVLKSALKTSKRVGAPARRPEARKP